jgi:DNA-binding NarL/FixJ family response regulator
MIRVLLVDDHTIVREGLRQSLEASGLAVVGEAPDGTSALEATADLLPDVVLMDVSLPDRDGVAVTRRLTAEHPDVHVVMLTMHADRATMVDAIRAGAAGYLVKDCTTAEIVELVRAVVSGETVLSPAVAERMLQAERRTGESLLSQREVEVLQLVAEGASTEAVAKRLYISVKTVKHHLANIYQKLDTRDRTQAVLQGLRMGIVRLR